MGSVRDDMLAALDAQDVAFDAVMRLVPHERSPGYPPLVQAMFELIDEPTLPGVTDARARAESGLDLTGMSVRRTPAPRSDRRVNAGFDVELMLRPARSGYHGLALFPAERWTEVERAAFVAQYAGTVAALCERPDAQVTDIQQLGRKAR